MPRTNFSREQDALRDVAALIDKYRRVEDMTRQELAERLGISYGTLLSRLRQTQGSFTILQPWRAATVLRIPEDEINAVLTAGTRKR